MFICVHLRFIFLFKFIHLLFMGIPSSSRCAGAMNRAVREAHRIFPHNTAMTRFHRLGRCRCAGTGGGLLPSKNPPPEGSGAGF
jgi:hypothetical protein